MEKEYKAKLAEVVADPSVHNWIKPVAIALQEHDPVDALRDCELLVSLCKLRLNI